MLIAINVMIKNQQLF